MPDGGQRDAVRRHHIDRHVLRAEREQPLELLGEYVGGLVGSLDVPCEEAFVLPWGPTIPILALFLCLAFLASAETKNLMRERLDWRLGRR